MITKLEVKKDNRGWLVEILKSIDVDQEKFGQLGLTVAHSGQIKGGHYHIRKREWFCVIRGNGLLILRDRETKKNTKIILGEKNMLLVEIPRNHIHWIKNVDKKDMFLLFYTNETFDSQDSDTFKDEKENLC